MGYIHKEVYEKDLIDEIANIFVEQGWELKGDFYKVAFSEYRYSVGKYTNADTSIFTNVNELEEAGRVKAIVAKHYIVSPPGSEMHYGIAVASEKLTVTSKDVKEENWVGNFATNHEEDVGTGEVVINTRYDKEGIRAFGDDVFKFLKDKINYNKIYLYMTAEEPTLENTTMLEVYQKEHTALDLEVQECEGLYTSHFGSTFKGLLVDAKPKVLQSPFSVMRTRSIDVVFDDSLSDKFPIANTNWHEDSLFEISGVVDEEYAFLVLQADSGPAYNNNVTPSVPFFFGKFEGLADDDKNNYALIAGSAFKTDDPTYDFDDPRPFDEEPLQPILKNYVSNPSNGVDNVTVLRTKGGAYYQAHHLFVEVSPNNVEPPRVHDKRKYPSAWSQADALAYNYQMNPSRYSGEVHASRIYIAHMDEGVRGYLDGLIATNPLSLLDGDTLKVKVDWCEDGYDEYEYKVLSSVSPFTKYPSTPFRPLGLGIIKSKYEEDK